MSNIDGLRDQLYDAERKIEKLEKELNDETSRADQAVERIAILNARLDLLEPTMRNNYDE